MRTPYRIATGALAALLVVGLGACGDDDDEGAGADETTTTEAAEAETVEITGADFRFDGVPDSIEAGTKLTLTNASDTELHEMVVFKLVDGETRSSEEIAALPEEELGAVFAGEPTTVLLRAPGEGPQIDAVGDGTLTEPGRYVLFCAIPQGVDPEAYLNAPPSEDGPPQVEGGDGAPHFTLGMHADLTVE